MTQPFLVVIHPIKKNLQSSFVDDIVGASVHTTGLHVIYPAVQGPSLPIIPEHSAIVYELHYPNESAHPLPVLRQALIHP